MSSPTMRYVLLCRHGPHQNHELITQGDPPKLPSEAVASRLSEQLRQPSVFADEPIHLSRIIYGTETETVYTAEVLKGATGAADKAKPIPVEKCDLLDPARFPTGSDSDLISEWIEGPQLSPGDGVLVVGHQPHLSWLSHELLKQGRLPGRNYAVPIAAAEVICIAVPVRPVKADQRGVFKRGRARLLWTIAADDKAAATEIRDKIKSKMDTAKVLASVITFGLGALLGILLDSGKCQAPTCRVPAQLSAGFLFAALVLYLATMYAYDRLLMPDRFWADRRPHRTMRSKPTLWHRMRSRQLSWTVRRPPSSTARILYLNMMRVWRGLFTTATSCVVFALLALAFAALQPSTWQTWGWVVTGLLVVGILAALLWFRPVVGSED